MFYLQEALALVVDIGTGMSQAPPGFDSPLQITSDILQMIVQRKVCHIKSLICIIIEYGEITSIFSEIHENL